MLYVLHHSKGALMLSADDRDQVLKWSERQLGKQAGLVSITESYCMDAVNTVERDGTGIAYGEDIGCLPLMGVMANIVQDAQREQGCSGRHGEPARTHAIKAPTWH